MSGRRGPSNGECWRDWSWKPNIREDLQQRTAAALSNSTNKRSVAAFLKGLSRVEREALLKRLGLKA